MAKKNWFKRVSEWADGILTANSLVQAEIVKHVLWPFFVSAVTGAAGYLGGVPLMWIIVGVAIVLSTSMTFLLNLSVYSERRTPLNKISIISGRANTQLTRAEVPATLFGNRQTRRAQGLLTCH